MRQYLARFAGAVLALGATVPVGAQPANGHGSIRALLQAPGRPVVVAHRGCHNAAPGHQLGEAPENSRAALEHCVQLGVDMMETDIHRTLDGYLVIMHDDTVDRTTDGRGIIADLTLADIRKLHLRQNEGSYNEPLTDQRVLTLDELLAAAKGRITINLDVKGPIYAEVVDAVHRAGMDDGVTVKTMAGIGSPALAALPPFDSLPFIAILNGAGDPAMLPRIARQQLVAGHLAAIELPHMPEASLAAVRDIAAAKGVQLFVNTLGDGFVTGIGADNSPPEEREAGWKHLLHEGVSFLQTDYPEELKAVVSQSRVGS